MKRNIYSATLINKSVAEKRRIDYIGKADIENKIGQIMTMNDGSLCKCIGYRNNKDCDFQFLDDHNVIVLNSMYINFLRGSIKNPYAPSVAGVGYLGVGYNRSNARKAYDLWSDMLQRCYSTRTDRRRDIGYSECSVDKKWYNFQNFVIWFNSNFYKYQVEDPMCLDKDLLIKRNKLYSENTCLLIPQTINIFLTTSKFARGDYPIGVSFDKDENNYVAQCCDPLNRYPRKIGRFQTPEIAFEKYKITKEKYAKDLADYYDGKIDQKAIDALRNFTVDIVDWR